MRRGLLKKITKLGLTHLSGQRASQLKGSIPEVSIRLNRHPKERKN
jgi:hypothetical protein